MEHFIAESGKKVNLKTMKRISLMFFILLFTSCCKDQIVNSFLLTDFEKEIIPYSGGENFTFVNENGESITAVSTPVERITDTERPGPESCDLSEYQMLNSRLRFQSLQFDIAIEITSLFGSKMQLRDIRYGEYDFRRFYLEREYGELPTIEESLKDISIADFHFENVLVFRNYDESSELHRIIISPQIGIVFIEYNNGNYLKIVE